MSATLPTSTAARDTLPPEILDPRAVQTWLGARPTAIDVLKHKPGKRAVVRFELSAGSLIGKTFADDRGRRQAALLAQLAEQGVPVPRVHAWIPALRLLVMEDLGGWTLRQELAAGAHDGLPMAGRIAAALHALPDDLGLPATDGGAEAASLRRRLDAATAARPDLGRMLRPLGADVLDALGATPLRCGTIHGELEPVQFVRSDAGLGLVDLDRVRRGPVAVDLGIFVTSLERQGIKNCWTMATTTTAARAFLDAYRRAGGTFDGAELRLGRALSCMTVGLRLLARYGDARRTYWEAMLVRCREVLA